MTTSILFVHGGGEGAFAEDAQLVEMLKSQLGESYTIDYPQMPDANSPEYDKWQKLITTQIEQMDDKRVLVGHSFGASIILKVLSETKIEHTITGVFLLATPFWGTPDWEVDVYKLRENFPAYLPDVPIFLYHNTDDDIVPVYHLDQYSNYLPDATIRKNATGGHQFSDGLVDLIRDIRETIV